MNDGRSLIHKHRIVPGHRGGEYKDGNIIEVAVVECNRNIASHCMWHWANFFLWGDIKDKKAAEGLAGFKNREEIIHEMVSEGGKKGGATRGKQMSAMTPELREVYRDVLAERMKGRLWWHNPKTGEHRRQKDCPGSEFVRGRNQYTEKWRHKLSDKGKGRPDTATRSISLADGMISTGGNIARHHTSIGCPHAGRYRLSNELLNILTPLTELQRLLYLSTL